MAWSAELGAWLVTSKALFDELQMDPERFVVDVPDNPQRVVLGEQMLVVDGSEHTRHPALTTPAHTHALWIHYA